MGRRRGLGARARDARFRVDDHPRRGEEAPTQKGVEGQERPGGIAAGVGHEARAGDVVAVDLGQPVDRLAEEGRRAVRAVPGLVGGQVAEAKVGREVHALDPRLERPRGVGGRCGVGGAEKDHVHRIERRVPRGDEDILQGAGVHVAVTLAGIGFRGGKAEGGLGVSRQEAQELVAGIARGAVDAHRDHGPLLSGMRGVLEQKTALRLESCFLNRLGLRPGEIFQTRVRLTAWGSSSVAVPSH